MSAQSPVENYSGTTFSERWTWADAVVIGRCTKTATTKHGNLVLRSYTFQTTRVLKDRTKSAKVGSEITTSYVYRAAKKGDEYLIFNFKDSRIGLPYGVPSNAALLAYSRQAQSPAAAPPNRMPYFVNH
ncbi:MAG: hypothetical protein IH899_18895, partial [Planctomycetes bacterium]|nr:hypothetical protein [Planctomycetota bacterium]